MSKANPKARTLAFVTEIDEAELAVRLMERGIQMKRKGANLTRPPREILAEMQASWPPECDKFPFGDMARIAIEYFRECIEKGQRPA